MIFSDGKSVFEADCIQRHIGKYADIPATDKDVSVPLCTIYDHENDQIKRWRVYFEIPALTQQLGT